MRPVLFYVPLVHLPIYGYGLMLALSLIVGWYVVLGLCERDGMDRKTMGRLYMWTALWSVVGSRLLYVLTNIDRLDGFRDVFAVSRGGLVAYGGFVGGFLASVVYSKVKRIRLLAWADCVVPSLGIGLFLTRIGCFLFGCDFGRPSAASWAVSFPRGSPAWSEQLAQHLITADAARSLPVHPTQIYEALNGLILFGLVMLVRRHRRFSGEMFAAFTMGYAVLRYLVEELRADGQRGAVGPFSTSQLIGIVTFALAAGLLVSLWRRWRRDPQTGRYWEPAPLGAAEASTPAGSVPAGRATRRRRRR